MVRCPYCQEEISYLKLTFLKFKYMTSRGVEVESQYKKCVWYCPKCQKILSVTGMHL